MSSCSRNLAARSFSEASPRLTRSTKIGLAVAAALAGAGTPYLPARADAPADSSSASNGALQEVIVTARKRDENLQDVPLSVDVFTKKDIQNLGITSFEDYATKVPSISFISTGPGTQVLVMRGASDGSSPNYANTSSTGFFVDDMSVSWFGTQPDLHLYDIERIEVLNGPQGTTFGAGSMTGAIRYITNKPDVNAFSAGVDFNAGQIQSAQQNWTYEGFLNIPIIQGILGFRASAFSDSHGGFIDNQLTTRTWVNGAVSNNAAWARNDYNREHVEGGRAALKAVFSDKWTATLTYSYQRQATLGAWDEDPALAPLTVVRFGPESHDFEAKTLDFHVDGDVGIGDLVFASTYWSLPTRQQNEYSQYIENYAGGAREATTCTNDPFTSSAYGNPPNNPALGYRGCNAPLQFYEYHTNPERWSDELRLVSKPGGRFHWLGGLYWEKTRDKNSGSTYYMPGLRTSSPAFQYLNYYNGSGTPTPPGSTSLPATEWYAYMTRSDYLQTTEFANISFDLTDKLNFEAGVVHFHSDFKYYSPFGQFAYQATAPALSEGSSHKWNSKFGLNYKITDHVMVYADFAQGFRDGGANSGLPQGCYNNGVPHEYTPDTLNNYEIGWKTTSLNGRLIWDGATYLMDWKQLQTIIYNVSACPSSSYYVNVGDARIYGVESNIDYKITNNWSAQASVSYNDSHIISSPFAPFQPEVGERLPFVPYFSWSWNARYEHPVGKDLNGYGQFDMAHKGDMWNDLNLNSTFTGLPRQLQPGYTIMNLRFGLTPAGGHWLAELYVTNLTNKNAIVYSNTGNYDLRWTVNEPRVYGLRLNYRFGKEANAE
jgi:iron complex outermembrane recepter protein